MPTMWLQIEETSNRHTSVTERRATSARGQQQSEKILTDIGRKMTSLKKHQSRVKYYTAKLEGRLKKSTPKKKSTPIRKITVA